LPLDWINLALLAVIGALAFNLLMGVVAGEIVVCPKVPWAFMLGRDNAPGAIVAAFCNLLFHTATAVDVTGEWSVLRRPEEGLLQRRGENTSL
jgi:hypothetical protein